MNWLAVNSTIYAYDNLVNCSGTLTPAFSRLCTVIPLPHADHFYKRPELGLYIFRDGISY
jgi:hypothetical protein